MVSRKYHFSGLLEFVFWSVFLLSHLGAAWKEKDDREDGSNNQKRAPTVFRSVCSGMVGTHERIEWHHVNTGR